MKKRYIYVCMYGGLPTQSFYTLKAACKECGFSYCNVSRRIQGKGNYVRGGQGIYIVSLHPANRKRAKV